MNVSKGFYEVFSFIQFQSKIFIHLYFDQVFECTQKKYKRLWKAIINRTDRPTNGIPNNLSKFKKTSTVHQSPITAIIVQPLITIQPSPHTDRSFLIVPSKTYNSKNYIHLMKQIMILQKIQSKCKRKRASRDSFLIRNIRTNTKERKKNKTKQNNLV